MAINPYEPPITEAAVQPTSEADTHDGLGRSSLLDDASFMAVTATQFLGAFNDNLFKQLLLLLFVAVPITTANGSSTMDFQGIAAFAFALPFILFSGYAGYLSDRYSKRRVIVLSKVAEAVIMAIGMVLLAAYAWTGLTTWLIVLLSVTLFLMGAQSAFFGPGKYGILPELFRDRDLPTANGLILMTTFLAIILGSALAGILMDVVPNRLWVSGGTCVGIAVLGTFTALGIRQVRAAEPKLRLAASNVAIPREISTLLWRDPMLRDVLIVSTTFWAAAAIVQLAVNALGDQQLAVDKRWTSFLVSTISIGIAVGSLIAGVVSRGKFNAFLIKLGAWGLVVCMALLALPGSESRAHVLGYWGCMLTLVAMGGFTGVFAVPLQVFLQSRPPLDLKGRLIATQNLLNWTGITISGLIYHAANMARESFQLPNSSLFTIPAMLMLLVAFYYRPRSEDL